MKTLLIAYVVVSLLALIAVLFALYFLTLSGTGLYDSHFDAFRHSLTPEQGDAIIRTSRNHLMVLIIVLATTNLSWSAFALWCMLRMRRYAA